MYGGVRSASSGGAITDEGDVAVGPDLIECKYKGKPGKEPKSFSCKLADLEKIVDEAFETGRSPGIALRIYNPDSFLADGNGFVDVMVRLLADDIERFNLAEEHWDGI